jgi:hypothetical protein
MRRTLWTLALLTIPPALAGCGPGGTIRVTGALLKGGAPYKAPAGQTLNLTFYALEVTDAAGKTAKVNNEPYAAVVSPDDGTFSVPGPEGRGIPPGKYRIALVRKMKREALEAEPAPRGKAALDRDTDLNKGAFGPERSPIVRELTTSCDLAIDLDRPEDASPPR